jgi:secreted trypsin-like serine protease
MNISGTILQTPISSGNLTPQEGSMAFKSIVTAVLISTMLACSPSAKNSAPINVQDKNAIIGGATANENAYPFIVNIWLTNPEEKFNNHLCGASLISSKWVLTAAHCLLEDITDVSQGTVKLKWLKIFINSNRIDGSGGRALTPKSIHIHPDFSWPHHDVALIELAQPVNDVAPVLLNTEDIGGSDSQQTARTLGWGLTDVDGLKDGELLQEVTVPLVDRGRCAMDSFVKGNSWEITSDILCAQTNNGTKSSCQGDSGGPVVQKINNGFVQVGIVSWGTACRGTVTIHTNVDGYADVADALPWIKSVTK